jgi:predicted permease
MRMKEIGGDVRGAGILESILRDVRHALRGFRRSPGFAATAVLMLALAIGANTAIFSFVDRLLLRALPYPNGDQLVMVEEHRVNPESRMSVSPANWLDWQRLSKSFDSIAGWMTMQVALTGTGEPERLDAQMVTHEFFPMLGVPPLLGRTLVPDDDRPGVPPRAILSYRLWQRKFAGDRAIVGKTIEVNAIPTEVIGVMPAGFRYPTEETELWGAFRLDRARDWREGAGRFMVTMGRLKSSVTLASSQTEMSLIARRLEELHSFNRNSTFRLVPLREELTGEVRTSVLVLYAAVGVLLLIGCMNVANLLLARSASRRQEFAIRVSLGAGKWALTRQLATESLLIAIAGGIVSVFVANWGSDLLLALAPKNLLLGSPSFLDVRVLIYTFGISALAGLLVAAMPAGTAVRGLSKNLRDGDRTTSRSVRLRQALIVGQVAMTVMLLCVAGLLARSLSALSTTNAGVRTADVLSMRVGLPGLSPPQRVAFFRDATSSLERLTGVLSAGAGISLPVSGTLKAGTSFHVKDEPVMPPGQWSSATIRIVTPGYFKTLGIPVVQGREFTDEDQREGSPLVFVVNEAFAKQYLPGGDPLKASISVRMQAENPYSRIVGVVGDVKEGSLREESQPTVFYDYSHLPNNFPASAGMVLFIRGDRTADIPQRVREIIRSMEKNAPISEVQWLDDAFSSTLSRERLNAVVSGMFGLSALLLASLGVYSLLAFAVAERRKEIGVRMALGAQAATVLGMVMKRGLALVGAGAAIGLIAALAMSRFVESLLFGVESHDPLTYAGITALLFAVTLLATFMPARSATKVDPLVALRQD